MLTLFKVDGSDVWEELVFSFDNSVRDFAEWDLKFYLQSSDPTQPYDVDEIYAVDLTTLYPPLVGLLRDGDFELFRFGDDNGPWERVNIGG